MTRTSFKTSPIAILLLMFGFLLPLALFTSVQAQTAGTPTLTVRVTGVRNTKGRIGVALFREADGFPNDASKAFRVQPAEIDAQTSSAQIAFKGIPQGVYAISVFHDENMNGKLDKNFLGVPKEGYGASNNPRKRLGAPTFDEAKFFVNSTDQTIEIKLIY